jgi:hypothetical protein
MGRKLPLARRCCARLARRSHGAFSIVRVGIGSYRAPRRLAAPYEAAKDCMELVSRNGLARNRLTDSCKGFSRVARVTASAPPQQRRPPPMHSFQHIETDIQPEVNGKHSITMEYRARNGFGGMEVEEAEGTVDHETCEATLIGTTD